MVSPSDCELRESIGGFVLTYSSIEFFVTSLLHQMAGNTQDVLILVQGMSYSVKSRKLQTLLKHKRKGRAADLLRLLEHSDEVNAFRDRLLHWSKFKDDAGVLSIKDVGRNPANLMQTQIEITAAQLKKLNRSMSDAQSCLFVYYFDILENAPTKGVDSRVQREAPPLPKGHQPKRNRPPKKQASSLQ